MYYSDIMLQNGALLVNKLRSILLDNLVVHTNNKMSFKVDKYSTVVAFPLQSLTQGANNLFDTSVQRHTERIYSIYIFLSISTRPLSRVLPGSSAS